MRTETKTYNVYQFSELSEKAQEKALQWAYEGMFIDEWWDYIYEDAARIGLKITGFDLDRNRGAEGKFTMAPIDVAMKVRAEHGPVCETRKTAETFIDRYDVYYGVNGKITLAHDADDAQVDELEEELAEHEEEFRKSLLEDYSIILQKEADYRGSREALIKTIEANGYEFLENGEVA